MDKSTEIDLSKPPSLAGPGRALVRVVAGPDQGATCTMRMRLRVGTAVDNNLVLTDPRVSRNHLEIESEESGYRVRDLGSTNGTYYRGAQVGEVLVEHGAEIRVGSTVLRVERTHEQADVITDEQRFGSLVGVSGAMHQVFGLLEAVAPTEATALILGETGTGKELVAEELHRNSQRRDGPFSVVDCGALPASLIESELFGHLTGAFTGAVRDRDGVFERTPGGTVFLDEISELPLELQTRLLRVLDKRTVTRLGSDKPTSVDVRLVAATNRDLAREVKEGSFRQDLYYRLAVVRIVLPPLRERREDIPLLARFFLWKAGCDDPARVLTPEIERDLSERSWSGNVRELRNVMERLMVLTDSSDLLGDDGIPDLARQEPSGEGDSDQLERRTLEQLLPDGFLDLDYKTAKAQLLSHFEAVYIQRLAERHGGNISRIARDAGVDRHVVRKLLEKHKRQSQPEV
jgi:DNA-binding NtrC family response regulator